MHDDTLENRRLNATESHKLKEAIARACRSAKMYGVPYIIDWTDAAHPLIYAFQFGLRKLEKHDFVFVSSRKPNPTTIIGALTSAGVFSEVT